MCGPRKYPYPPPPKQEWLFGLNHPPQDSCYWGPHPLVISNDYPCGWYGYFQEAHKYFWLLSANIGNPVIAVNCHRLQANAISCSQLLWITIECHKKSPVSTSLCLNVGVCVFLSVLPRTLRVDRGTETDVMATIHCFLRGKHGDLENPTDVVLYGPSTQNKIERWWRDLHERMERFFKDQLNVPTPTLYLIVQHSL